MEYLKKFKPNTTDAKHVYFIESGYMIEEPIQPYSVKYSGGKGFSTWEIISYLTEARENVENICLHLIEDGVEKYTLYSLFQVDDEWFLGTTEKTRAEYVETLELGDNDTLEHPEYSITLYAPEKHVDRFYTSEIDAKKDKSASYTRFIDIYEALIQAKKENKNISFSLAIGQHWMDHYTSMYTFNKKITLNSLVQTEEEWFESVFQKSKDVFLAEYEQELKIEAKKQEEAAALAEKTKLIIAEKQKEVEAIKTLGKSLIFPELEDLFEKLIENYSYHDKEGHITEVYPIVKRLVECLKLIEEDAAIEEIKKITRTDSYLPGLLLQFSKKGPEFAKAYRGNELTSEDMKYIREIEERNADFSKEKDTMSPFRKRLINRIKQHDETGTNSPL